jgi:hypothetical protein
VHARLQQAAECCILLRLVPDDNRAQDEAQLVVQSAG